MGSFYSASWHRVSRLKPRLRAHVALHRQVHRGQVWYVIQDNQTGRYHRLSRDTHGVLALMDGERSMEEIWAESARLLGARQPSQDDLIGLLTFLHNGDLLLGGRLPDMAEMSERSRTARRKEIMARFRNPMALRFRLLDPDRFLQTTLPAVGWLFSPLGALLWLALVLAGLVVAVQNLPELTGGSLEQVLTANNLLLLFGLYPVMKVLHELGHAYAVKKWGGEVHEIGIMMLVLMPSPYVDASASIAFPDKWKRALVGAAGIAVEMALAALAVIVWSLTEPGLVRAVALNVALIGSVSTLLFNGNPLLRFDGYYVLSDLIESPNLGSRSNGYLIWLAKRHMLGMAKVPEPELAPGERGWFVGYGIAAFIYRMIVMIGISIYIAGQLFFVGVALAIFSVFTAIVLPLAKGLRFLFTDPALGTRRRRAIAGTSAAVAALLALLFLVPLPYGTVATGILWVDDEGATIRAGADGFVSRLHHDRPAPVATGAILVSMADSELASRAELARRRVEELEIRRNAAGVIDLVKAQMLGEQVEQEKARLAENERQLAALEIRAPADGIFAPAAPIDAEGQFARRGALFGFLLRPEDRVVRVVVPHTQIGPVREHTRAIAVRLADAPATAYPARLLREQPGAASELPSAALAAANGGPIATDPQDPEQMRPLETVYVLDLAVEGLAMEALLGQRVHARFSHPAQPLGFRVIRAVRQLFLRHFNV